MAGTSHQLTFSSWKSALVECLAHWTVRKAAGRVGVNGAIAVKPGGSRGARNIGPQPASALSSSDRRAVQSRSFTERTEQPECADLAQQPSCPHGRTQTRSSRSASAADRRRHGKRIPSVGPYPLNSNKLRRQIADCPIGILARACHPFRHHDDWHYCCDTVDIDVSRELPGGSPLDLYYPLALATALS